MVVRLSDVNDNAPRLARSEWYLEIDETWGDGTPDNSTLLTVAANDKDTSNYFFYRVRVINAVSLKFIFSTDSTFTFIFNPFIPRRVLGFIQYMYSV